MLISAGNAAYSLVQYAKEAGIDVSAVVDRNLTDTIKQVLRKICASVIELDLSEKVLGSDALIELARTSVHEKIMDVTNGFHDAYRTIVRELKATLPKQPDAIFMPFGGGEAMTGILNGVTEVGWKEGTHVYGIHNKASERLKTSYFHIDHAKCMSLSPQDPLHAVYEIQSLLPQRFVPACIRVEEASSHMFSFVSAEAEKIKARGEKNIVLINSGYGKVLDEAATLNGDQQ